MKKVILISFTFLSCGITPHASETKIVNGKTSNGYHGVVMYKAFKSTGGTNTCTGTFISPRVMITATHCLENASKVVYNNYETTRYLTHSAYMAGPFHLKYDLAVVKFSSDVTRYFEKIATETIAFNDQVTLVGYGYNDYMSNGKISSRATMGTKREGYNVFENESSLFELGYISISGNYQNLRADGQDASGGSADSGGPLFVKGKGIVGIYSGHQFYNNLFTSYYASTTSPEALEFFQLAKSKGMWL